MPHTLRDDKHTDGGTAPPVVRREGPAVRDAETGGSSIIYPGQKKKKNPEQFLRYGS